MSVTRVNGNAEVYKKWGNSFLFLLFLLFQLIAGSIIWSTRRGQFLDQNFIFGLVVVIGFRRKIEKKQKTYRIIIIITIT